MTLEFLGDAAPLAGEAYAMRSGLPEFPSRTFSIQTGNDIYLLAAKELRDKGFVSSAGRDPRPTSDWQRADASVSLEPGKPGEPRFNVDAYDVLTLPAPGWVMVTVVEKDTRPHWMIVMDQIVGWVVHGFGLF